MLATISVIVPCYNVQEYVAEALNSIRYQSLAPNEVIIIDDGSTDGTFDILSSYSDLLGWKVIRTSNNGLGAARNLGARIATSEFLIFIDSDDFIEHDLVSDFFDVYVRNRNLDMFAFSVNSFDNKTKELLPNKSHFYTSVKTGEGKNIFSQLMYEGNFNSMVPHMIVRRDLINWWKDGFKNILHEDEEMTPRLFILSSKIYLTNKPYYNYRRLRDNSIMASVGKKVFLRSRWGYFVALLSCINLLIKSYQEKKLFLALLLRVKYLSYYAFIPILMWLPRFVRKLF